MARKRLAPCLGSLAAACLLPLALLGCGSGQSGAKTFISEHGTEVVAVRESARNLTLAIDKLASTHGQNQLGEVARIAQEGHDRIAAAHAEWTTSESSEEEDLANAEVQIDEAAAELKNAMGQLVAYGNPSRAALARYAKQLAAGREKWDEGVTEIWFLAHRRDPPTI